MHSLVGNDPHLVSLFDSRYWFSYNLFYLFLVPSQYTMNKSSWVYLTWPYCTIHMLIVHDYVMQIMLCKVLGISHCVHFVTLLGNLTHTLQGLRKFLNYRHLNGHKDIYPHIVPNPNYGLILWKYWLVGFLLDHPTKPYGQEETRWSSGRGFQTRRSPM